MRDIKKFFHKSMDDLRESYVRTKIPIIEQEFYAAVAVSTDGTQLVHADEVIVVDEDNDLLFVFPANSFHERKIVRNPRMDVHVLAFDTKQELRGFSYAQWISALVKSKYHMSQGGGQLLHIDRFKHWDGKTRLITCKCFCPDPLPEDGVLLT